MYRKACLHFTKIVCQTFQHHTGTGSAHANAHIHQQPHSQHKHTGLPLPPPPPYSDGSTGSGSTGYNRNNVEHIYESPKFTRRSCGEDANMDNIPSPLEYYELDPSEVRRGQV